MSEDACLYKIRLAYLDEWGKTMTFVWRTFMQSEGAKCSEDGKRRFLDFITDKALRDSFMNGEYLVLLALDGEAIVGAAAVRYHNHLSLLFVDKNYQFRGIGRTLLNTVVEYARKMGERYVSLQAVSDAVAFYRKQGFRAVRPEEEFSGIHITYMEKYF